MPLIESVLKCPSRLQSVLKAPVLGARGVGPRTHCMQVLFQNAQTDWSGEVYIFCGMIFFSGFCSRFDCHLNCFPAEVAFA